MIRLASTGLVAVALLTAAVLWFPAAPVPPELVRAATPWIDRAARLARDVASGRAPGGAGAPRGGVERGDRVPGAAREAAGNASGTDVRGGEVEEREHAASRRPARRGSGPAAEPAAPSRRPAAAPEPVTEQRLAPPASLPFDDGWREEPGTPPLEPGAPAELAAAPDQEEWAGLIRRMLAIYHRVGSTE